MKRFQQFCMIAFLCSCLPLTQRKRAASIKRTNLGTIVDPQGAVVPGAKVTATNQATGTGRQLRPLQQAITLFLIFSRARTMWRSMQKALPKVQRKT